MPIFLNSDAGELENEPEELYLLVAQVNIACGGHAGTAASMQRCVELSARHRVRIAAHPSYPDLEQFGRVVVPITHGELSTTIENQCNALRVIADAFGLPLTMVKPHGALYHECATRLETAEVVLAAAIKGMRCDIGTMIGPPSSRMRDAAVARGWSYLAEGFADRVYESDGTLRSRTKPGALITDPDECAAQALRLARAGTAATICVHSDTPNALAISRAVRTALENARLLVTQ
jgi:UPF0271 protein